MPVVAGSEINDHPYHPISKYARDLVAEQGDDTPIDWIGREQRYHEKLATPDVTIADLIGEVDMIKHAEGRYLSSELTMHFGLIPRTNRGIFCINELPDLAPKIQVGLFNVLEERDVQIRGYPIRLDLDLCMVFSANPEDYTNRGRIVTPLKDRIGSVIRTHYPADPGDRHRDQRAERLARPATATASRAGDPALHEGDRRGDLAAGPDARRTSTSSRASRSGCRSPTSRTSSRTPSGGRSSSGERWIVPRVSDLGFAAASSRGKLELTMTEDEGHEDKLIHRIIDEAVKNIFGHHFDVREFRPIVDYFESGQSVEIGDMLAGQGRARPDRQGARPAQAGRGARPRSSCPTSTTATPATRPPPARPSSSSRACTSTTS